MVSDVESVVVVVDVEIGGEVNAICMIVLGQRRISVIQGYAVLFLLFLFLKLLCLQKEEEEEALSRGYVYENILQIRTLQNGPVMQTVYAMMPLSLCAISQSPCIGERRRAIFALIH